MDLQGLVVVGDVCLTDDDGAQHVPVDGDGVAVEWLGE
jgi:hypothetical protein